MRGKKTLSGNFQILHALQECSCIITAEIFFWYFFSDNGCVTFLIDCGTWEKFTYEGKKSVWYFYTSEGQYYGIWRNNVIFSDWAETLSWAFCTSWTMRLPITYLSVILWPFSCVIISISKYLPISTKFGANIIQCDTSWCFFLIQIFRFILTF